MKLFVSLWYRGLLFLSVFWIGASISVAQSIWTNPITGTNPNLSNPYTTGDVFDANITVSGIGRGTGAVGTNANDRYNANSWNTGTIDLTAYFEFTLTPNPGCEIDFSSFVYTGQSSGTGPTSFAFRSSVDGYTANIGAPTAGGTTINLSAGAYQNISTAITFRFYGWGASASGGTFSINDFTFNGTITCGCSGPVAQPTTETTADSATPSCTSAIINWTASTTADNVIVVVSTGAIGSTPTDGTAYTASASYGSGETIGANQYVVYNGAGTTVTVTGLTAGTSYNYAIFGYDGAVADCEENYLTGGNFGSFTTLTTCDSAQITSLIINSCNGGAEGTDELIIIQNGSEPVDIDDMYLDLPNSDWCNSGCGGGANTLVNNPTYVSDLNTMAGCIPDLFVYSNPIPAGATIMIFTGDPPSTVLDYSANCGAPGAPIYVIFMNNSSTTGNFGNSGTSTKIIEIDFGNGHTDSVAYYPDDVDQNDGGSVNYDDAGNPTYYTSNNCVYPLSARLAYFNAELTNEDVSLDWATFSYDEMELFSVERSYNGTDFHIIGEIQINGNSDQFEKFEWNDKNYPDHSRLYYRIGVKSLDQKWNYSEIKVIHFYSDLIRYTQNQITFMLDPLDMISGDVFIYSANGALIQTADLFESLTIPFHHKGIYFVSVPEKHLVVKLVCF